MLKQLIHIAFVLVLFSSCKQETPADTDTEVTAIDADTIVTEPDTPVETSTGPIYRYNDTLGSPVKVREITNETQLTDLIAALNELNGNGKVKLDYVKVSSDTVYVKIDNSAYLTQQMGTLGARAYMSVATYTLTEKPGINYVTFHFEEGDHAAPGTYSRKSFKNE